MLDPELELSLRAAINPVYEDVRGTESYERKRLLGEIDRLRDALKKSNLQTEHFEREWYLRGDEIERLRGYFEFDANCPCCQQSRTCEDGCSFAEDAPDDYQKMVHAREILTPNA